MKDGKTMPMRKHIIMSNGTKVMTDGTTMKKDAVKIKMKEGDKMDMDGNMMPMKDDNKDGDM